MRKKRVRQSEESRPKLQSHGSSSSCVSAGFTVDPGGTQRDRPLKTGETGDAEVEKNEETAESEAQRSEKKERRQSAKNIDDVDAVEGHHESNKRVEDHSVNRSSSSRGGGDSKFRDFRRRQQARRANFADFDSFFAGSESPLANGNVASFYSLQGHQEGLSAPHRGRAEGSSIHGGGFKGKSGLVEGAAFGATNCAGSAKGTPVAGLAAPGFLPPPRQHAKERIVTDFDQVKAIEVFKSDDDEDADEAEPTVFTKEQVERLAARAQGLEAEEAEAEKRRKLALARQRMLTQTNAYEAAGGVSTSSDDDDTPDGGGGFFDVMTQLGATLVATGAGQPTKDVEPDTHFAAAMFDDGGLVAGAADDLPLDEHDDGDLPYEGLGLLGDVDEKGDGNLGFLSENAGLDLVNAHPGDLDASIAPDDAGSAAEVEDGENGNSSPDRLRSKAGEGEGASRIQTKSSTTSSSKQGIAAREEDETASERDVAKSTAMEPTSPNRAHAHRNAGPTTDTDSAAKVPAASLSNDKKGPSGEGGVDAGIVKSKAEASAVAEEPGNVEKRGVGVAPQRLQTEEFGLGSESLDKNPGVAGSRASPSRSSGQRSAFSGLASGEKLRPQPSSSPANRGVSAGVPSSPSRIANLAEGDAIVDDEVAVQGDADHDALADRRINKIKSDHGSPSMEPEKLDSPQKVSGAALWRDDGSPVSLSSGGRKSSVLESKETGDHDEGMATASSDDDDIVE
ncbi:unnamed protein product [Amoebophrya sp. A25]|nr:unnamed protein product [Amoebophrya sp. A25]|eukprot:GSA25T00009893001.1